MVPGVPFSLASSANKFPRYDILICAMKCSLQCCCRSVCSGAPRSMWISNAGVWPKACPELGFGLRFLLCAMQSGRILAGLWQSSGGQPEQRCCFRGGFSCSVVVSAGAATLGFCLHPRGARENLCSEGPPRCGRTLCARTKEYCVGMRHEREGRGLKGFFHCSLPLDSNISPINLPSDSSSVWELS